jgi:hypothetical protein
MREAIYILCAITCLLCMVMLLRGYLRSRTRLLLWSSVCFAGLLANNVMLLIDKILYAQYEDFLTMPRALAALAGLLILVYGLVWDAE